jgi:hypothetical protein
MSLLTMAAGGVFSQNSLVSVINELKDFYIFHLIVKEREEISWKAECQNDRK